MQIRADESSTVQSRAEQSRAEQSISEQSRAELIGAEASRTDQNRAEQVRAEPNRADQIKVEQRREVQRTHHTPYHYTVRGGVGLGGRAGARGVCDEHVQPGSTPGPTLHVFTYPLPYPWTCPGPKALVGKEIFQTGICSCLAIKVVPHKTGSKKYLFLVVQPLGERRYFYRQLVQPLVQPFR